MNNCKNGTQVLVSRGVSYILSNKKNQVWKCLMFKEIHQRLPCCILSVP